MLKCSLSQRACRQVSATLTRFSSSESFKDRWPAKISELEQRNPVRLKRRPQLFANIKQREHHLGRHKREDHQKGAYVYANGEEMGTQYPPHTYSRKSRHGASRGPDRFDRPNRSDWRDDSRSSQSSFANQNRRARSHSNSDRSDYLGQTVGAVRNHLREHEEALEPRLQQDSLTSELLPKLKELRLTEDDDEMFGQYSKKSQNRLQELLQPDSNKGFVDEREDNFIRLSHENRGPNSIHTYESKIERFCKQGRLAEAQDYFEKIVKEYRVKPTSFIYSNLIKGYAKKGNLKRCLSLYSDMKKMNLNERDDHIYTSLFEACSRITDKEEALEAATRVLGTIRHDSVEMSGITYKAGVKCFGSLGDLETAFRLADECSSWQKNDEYMLSSLLIACNSHKTAGFQLAVSVWRALRKKRHFRLTTKQYNLLLRTLDTGSGNIHSFTQLIQHPTGGDHSKLQPTPQAALPHTFDVPKTETASSLDTINDVHTKSEALTTENVIKNTELVSVPAEQADCNMVDPASVQQDPAAFLPDILNFKHKLPSDIEIRCLDKPYDRLMLLGGVSGVLRRMKAHECDPDIITFFYLLRALPNEKKYEDGLLQVMQEHHVTPDGKYYQYLFWRMTERHSSNELWDCYLSSLDMGVIHTEEAYSTLAGVCTTLHKCRQLLTHMQDAKVTPTLPMFKSLLRLAGCTHFDHLKFILEEINKHSIRPDGELCDILARKLETGKSKLVSQEINQDQKPRMPINGEELRNYSIFYKEWLQSSVVAGAV